MRSWTRCTSTDTTRNVRVAACEPATSAASRAIATAKGVADAAINLRGDTSTQALHELALLDLNWRLGSETGLDRSLGLLEDLVARRAEPASLNDLAVAQLAVAQRDQKLLPLLRALDAIERAAVTSTSPAVLFNRALIRERLLLLAEARDAWKAYTAAETSPDWKAEGEDHVHALSLRLAVAKDLPAPDELLATWPSSKGSYQAQPVRDLSRAREVGWAMLGKWGDATLATDTATSKAALEIAEWLARSHTDSADQSFPEALSLVLASTASPAKTQQLARAHRAYSAGFALYANGENGDGIAELSRAERLLQAAGSPAARWAAYYRGMALLNSGRSTKAARIFHELVGVAPSAEPALHGKAIWGLGLLDVRQGSYESAAALYRAASRDFTRAGERENVGMLASLLAEALDLAGAPDGARAEALHALNLLTPLRNSRFLQGHLGLVAHFARANGYPLAATAITQELLATTKSRDNQLEMAWTHALRGRDLAAAGLRAESSREFGKAMAWVDSTPAGTGRDGMRSDIVLEAVRSGTYLEPAAAAVAIKGVVDRYRRLKSEIALPSALREAARAALAVGDSAAAVGYLEQAIEVLDSQERRFPTSERRTRFFEAWEDVYDDMIGLQLDMGHDAQAFAILERSRRTSLEFVDQQERAVGERRIRELQRGLPDSAVVMDFAVLPARLVTWIVTRDSWHTHTTRISRDSISGLTRRYVDHLSSSATAESELLSSLFDLLVRPGRDELSRSQRLYVVPDRELARVSFASLWDARQHRFLVEQLAIVRLPNAAFLTNAAASRASPSDAGRALVVGNPAFDAGAFPELARLPGSDREAAAVAHRYSRADLLTGENATKHALLARLPDAELFHFAGHAVQNVVEPERSYLLLAGVRDGALTAREIANLRLSNLRLVVLSACLTSGERATHSGALAGLALGFLRAGAPASISSVWNVGDAETEKLLIAFYQHYGEGHDAAEALRAAQIKAIRSDANAHVSIWSWAAFVYTGV